MENLSTYFILFIIYSFLGWVVEVINCSIVEKKVVNRGFLISPICPIYGCGAILITLVLSNYKDDWFVVFCMAVILCGTLEYFTSWLMEKLFHARWWDYSQNKFNINGRICLETMIPFGLLGLLIIYVLNPFFYNLLSYIPSNVSNIISLVLFIILIADMIISCNVISKVTSTVKKVAAQNKKDDTYEITAKARELLKSNWKGRRLLDAFPNIETIKEKVKKVANDTAEKAAEKVKKVASDTAEKAKKVANDTAEKVKKVANDTADKGKKAVEISKKAIEKGKEVANKKIEINKKNKKDD